MTRPFDPDSDESYHPDDTPELYLTDAQVRSYLKRLPKTNDEAELEARSVLAIVEADHRSELLGETVQRTGPQRIEAFRKRFGYWPWDTSSARRFYELLGN